MVEDASTIRLLSASGTCLGIYKTDVYTTTARNEFLGYGNILMSLLED